MSDKHVSVEQKGFYTKATVTDLSTGKQTTGHSIGNQSQSQSDSIAIQSAASKQSK
jgi:hypothetical protein